MTFANIVYTLTASIILYVIIQPRVSYYFELKKEFKKGYEDLTTELEKILNKIRVYDGYQGKTKMEIFSLIEEIQDVRSLVEMEKKKKWINSTSKERNQKIYQLVKKGKDIKEKFEQFKQKEVKVFDYLNELEAKIFEGDNSLKDKYEMVNKMYGEDIVKAYDFIHYAKK